MKDYLQDIVKHTHALGVLDMVKVVGSDKETNIYSIADKQSVVLNAKFHNPIADFIGDFGMPQLSKLNVILNIPEYKENADISVKREMRNEVETPTVIKFSNKDGDFNNEYRLMSSEITSQKMGRVAKFKGASWQLEFAPTAQSIQRLKFQAQANSGEAYFQFRIEDNNLKIYFGDPSTHGGSFVFQPEINHASNRTWKFPVSIVINILNLTGDKVIQISEAGIMRITVDSGIGLYQYIIPVESN